MQDFWQAFLTETPLAMVMDLDCFLAADEESTTPAFMTILEQLVRLPAVHVELVSGRPRAALDQMFAPIKGLNLVAEYGIWSRGDGDWISHLLHGDASTEALATELEAITKDQVGAFVERKTSSVALHYLRVPRPRRQALLVQTSAVIQRWLKTHHLFERLDGQHVIEVRPSPTGIAFAASIKRQRREAGTRILAIGTGLVNEEIFDQLGPGDATVIVASDPGKPTSASWLLRSQTQALAFLQAYLNLRQNGEALPAECCPAQIRQVGGGTVLPEYNLLVISNRLPELRSADAFGRTRSVGGLVAALHPVMQARHGIWLGWSGRTLAREDPNRIGFDETSDPPVAWLDYSEAWHRDYYKGFCNSTLWPLFHSFPERMQLQQSQWQAYADVNQAFAQTARKLVSADAMVWVHDYHLLLLGRCLKKEGHRGPVGLFLHIPFPAPDMFMLLPCARVLLEALLDFDLIGFHTPGFVANFLRCVSTLDGVVVEGDRIRMGPRSVQVGAFPIGIMPETFQEKDPAAADEVASLKQAMNDCELILGVDRLDYTKGIPERIKAFGSLLEHYPQWRRKVALVQISVPSRADIADYEEQRSRVEEVVGRINGQFGDTDWVPIRYLYRSYSHAQLAELYRAARVGYVTPLRDGMNLVAKEYVAAQDPQDPGVLLLSQFAGAAEELRDAILCNPWDIEGMAKALDFALRLELPERQRRHLRLDAKIRTTTAETWARDFLEALADTTPMPPRQGAARGGQETA